MSSYWLSSRITRPISQLSLLVEEAVRSEFSHKITHIRVQADDEIENLSRNFENMLEEIQQRLIEVREKTHELELQNEELNTINTQLLQSEDRLSKLNSVKDKFFSIISHDLRSPLHTILGFMKVMESHANAFSPQETKDFALDAQKSVERLIDLLENLLQWSLSQTGDLVYQPQILNLKEIIRENIDLYKHIASDKEISLIEKVEPDLFVRADPNMLCFVLRNLFSNAIKFSHAQSNIYVQGSSDDFSAEVRVIDHGIGMAHEMASKVFMLEEHYSSPGTKQEKGTGFGLLMCKNFIEKNNGQITIESREGRGTTVTFTSRKSIKILKYDSLLSVATLPDFTF
ncbi:MAG: HAMP domain-containing protein [Bacteroidia bacterium]|nr:HAMP domain-containing protein [Bacteroidia bacterium]